MKLYILRHGETQWNVQKRLQGASDTELNENGIALAEKTGEALKEIPFYCCFTSPLKRAKDTEICFGEWEGENSSLLPQEMLYNFFHNTKDYKAPRGGEELTQICARTRDFWEDITSREELQDKNILIASHGCAVRALLQNVYEDADIANFWHGKVPPNCSVNIVEIKENKAVLLEEDVVYYVR